MLARSQCPARLEDGALERAIALPGACGDVSDRNREVFAARLRNKAGAVFSEDDLYLCPFSEFRQTDMPLIVEMKEVGDGYSLVLECAAFKQMIALECNHKILCSDNYFPLLSATRKTVHIEVLVKTGDAAPVLEVYTPLG